MGPRRNTKDCFFYYRGFCYKGNRCSFRHEPRAFGSRVVCKRWQKQRCYVPNCPQRHSSLRNRDYWEDRHSHTSFLKCGHFLDHPATRATSPDSWVRDVFLDSSTFNIRKSTPYCVENENSHEEHSTRDNIRIILRRNQRSLQTSENKRFAISRSGHRHTSLSQNYIFLSRYRELKFSSDTIDSQQGTDRRRRFYVVSPSNPISDTSIINMRYSNQNNMPWEKETSTAKIREIISFERDSEKERNKNIAAANSGVVNQEFCSDSNNNLVPKKKIHHTKPLGSLTFLTGGKKQKQNTHLKMHIGHLGFVNSIDDHHNNGNTSQHMWNQREPLNVPDNWNDKIPEANDYTNSNENSQGTWHIRSSIDDSDSISSSASIIIHDEDNFPSSLKEYEFNETYGTKDQDSFFEQFKNNTTTNMKKNYNTQKFNDSANDESCTTLPKRLSEDIFRKRSQSVHQQPIPRIRLKRSRSAGSKDTWKIHSPMSKTMKYSQDTGKNISYSTSYITLPHTSNIQADVPSSNMRRFANSMFQDTSGSDVIEGPSHQYTSRTRTRDTSSVSV